MRYLLHHSDSTYDAATKRFTFTLDKRISNPVFFRVNKVTFTAPTADTYPSVVYLRSNALTSLSKTKHTVELKSDDHENNSNVLAVLEETHTKGRYAMKGTISFPVHGHTSSRSIDVYFTDGTTVLAGESVPAPLGIADSDIEGITDLTLWMDMAPNTLLDSNYAETPDVGDSVRYIYQNSNADITFLFSGYDDFEVTAFGQGRGISSDVSWQYANDSTIWNGWHGQGVNGTDESYTIVFAMKTPDNTITGYTRVFDFYSVKVWIRQGTFAYELGGSSYPHANVSMLPLKDYLITIKRADIDGNGTYSYYTTIERLDTNVVTVGDEVTALAVDINAHTTWKFSTAAEHYLNKSGVMSYLIGFLGTDATSILNAQKWIRAQYDGDSTAEASAGASTEDASFFVELEVKARNK